MAKEDILLFSCYGMRGEGRSYVEHMKEKDKEIERLNKKIEQYENPEDMTLMFMWCNEKAKDEIERLNNIIDKIELALELNIEDLKDYSEMQSRVDEDKEILRFIKELKGSDKE